MEIRIKGLAQGGNLSDAQLGKDLLQLVHRHLHPFFVGFVGGVLLQGPLQVIIDGKKRGGGIRLGVVPDGLLLLGGPLSVVVVLRGQAEKAVVEVNMLQKVSGEERE